VILTGDASGGTGARIFRSKDFAKNFIHTELPFQPLMQIMYNPQNSDVLTVISTKVRAYQNLCYFFMGIEKKVTNHLISEFIRCK